MANRITAGKYFVKILDHHMSPEFRLYKNGEGPQNDEAPWIWRIRTQLYNNELAFEKLEFNSALHPDYSKFATIMQLDSLRHCIEKYCNNKEISIAQGTTNFRLAAALEKKGWKNEKVLGKHKVSKQFPSKPAKPYFLRKKSIQRSAAK